MVEQDIDRMMASGGRGEGNDEGQSCGHLCRGMVTLEVSLGRLLQVYESHSPLVALPDHCHL